MQSRVPCRVWTNLREKAMGHFWDGGEPNVPRVIEKCEHRVDRVRCLGNAVVPQQFFPFFDAIYKISYADRE